MLNQAIIVGRLVGDVEIRKVGNEKRLATTTLAVSRSYKNEEGNYDTDFIDIVLWNDVATNTAEFCRKGDLIGIKGRLQTSMYENEEGLKKKITELIAEKVTFLSSKKENA